MRLEVLYDAIVKKDEGPSIVSKPLLKKLGAG